jgi:Na+-translocating ferredoxin:NAD+ oxidoreductase RNF subunit RnfB
MNGIIILTLTAFIISFILVIVSDKFKKHDEEIHELLKRLPGINCAMCGYNTCEGMANALLEDKEVYKKCKVLRGDKLEEMKSFLSKE